MLKMGPHQLGRNKQHTLRRKSRCESISEFEKQQFDKVISLLVALNDRRPSVSPRIRDLVVHAIGEGSSTSALEFINFCSNI